MKSISTKSIVSLSGGMDSATVLAVAMLSKSVVGCFGFSYGSKHNRYENEAAEKLAQHYGITFTLVDVSSAFGPIKSNLLLSGGDIPEGHYEAESMKQTVVPGRNMVFCSLLAGYAVSLEASAIWIGVHAGDHAIYPDCRAGFVKAMEVAMSMGTGELCCINAPFLHQTKYDILKLGTELDVPYELTRTCYKDQPIACGKCGSCQERLEAFAMIGKEDLIPYESRDILPKTP